MNGVARIPVAEDLGDGNGEVGNLGRTKWQSDLITNITNPSWSIDSGGVNGSRTWTLMIVEEGPDIIKRCPVGQLCSCVG